MATEDHGIDRDNLHVIGFDHAGTYEHFKKQQTDIYQIILEILANALDSKQIGKPHKITVWRNKHPVTNPEEPILEIKDGGDGIAMDYDDDVYKMIEAVKAHSRKPLQKYKIGSKGIGMLQFINIAPTVVFTSMYNDLIAKFGLVETKPEGDTEPERHRRVGAFTHPKVIAANDKNKDEYDIIENGTKVSFYDRNPNLSWIQPKRLMQEIAKEYAMRFAENERLEILVNGKRVQAPQRYKDNPPTLLFKTSKGYEVRGAIWGNPKGSGSVEMFRGHRVCDQNIELRQCEGYAECWELEPDTSRVSFVDNETTKEVIEGLRKIIRQYPSIKDDPENKKQMENVREMASLMLADLIPPAPVKSGPQNNQTKQTQSGDSDGNDTLGYKKGKDPDPNRVIKRRKGGKHEKHGTVGKSGTDTVNRNDTDESNRQQEYQLINKEVNYGVDKPLMKLFNEPGRVPALLTINKDNDEYPVYKETFGKDPKSFNLLMGVWMADIRQEKKGAISEQIRFESGQDRVAMWKITGRYPKAAIVTR